MPRNPKVLGAFAKTHLQVIDGHGESLAARVRVACDPETLAAIDKCSRISWLPIDHHLSLTETLFAEAGAAQARELCRLSVLASFEQPFMKPLFQGALAVLGKEFPRFARWAPKAWGSIFRHVGDLTWTVRGESEGCLRLTDVEPRVLASPAYLEGLAGGFSAMLEVTDCRGEVAVAATDLQVEFSFTWES